MLAIIGTLGPVAPPRSGSTSVTVSEHLRATPLGRRAGGAQGKVPSRPGTASAEPVAMFPGKAEILHVYDVARIRSTVAGRRGRLPIGTARLLGSFWERWLVIGRGPVRQRTASQDLERGTEPIGFGLTLGEPAAEVFDLVALMRDGGVIGSQLRPVKRARSCSGARRSPSRRQYGSIPTTRRPCRPWAVGGCADGLRSGLHVQLPRLLGTAWYRGLPCRRARDGAHANSATESTVHGRATGSRGFAATQVVS
jgi:hypothetical protein